MAMGEATRHHTTLHEGQGHLGEDRQRGDQHGAGEYLHVVALGQPVDDVAAQAAPRDEGGEGGGGDDLHGRGAHAGHDHGQCHGYLDP